MWDNKSSLMIWYVTFFLVEWWQDAVVSADLEVDLLLHTIRDCSLWDNDANTCLNGAQDTTVTIEDTSSSRNHCVALIFIIIIVQGTGAGRQKPSISHSHIQHMHEFILL